MKVELRLVEQPVTAELYNPPPLPCEPIRYEFAVLPCVVRVSCEFSTEKPNHILLLKFLVTRNPYCLSQLKPTVYCGSMVIGVASLRLSKPSLVSVTRLHIWPPVKVQPLWSAAWAKPAVDAARSYCFGYCSR